MKTLIVGGGSLGVCAIAEAFDYGSGRRGRYSAGRGAEAAGARMSLIGRRSPRSRQHVEATTNQILDGGEYGEPRTGDRGAPRAAPTSLGNRGFEGRRPGPYSQGSEQLLDTGPL